MGARELINFQPGYELMKKKRRLPVYYTFEMRNTNISKVLVPMRLHTYTGLTVSLLFALA